MNLIKNIFLSIGLMLLILGWLIALPFLMLYDKLFGGWRKDINEEK
jgi:type III secretory pathway component EscR